MIRPVERSDLPACLQVFHRGYEPVAIEFGLTLDNCPDRGRADLPMEKLTAEFDQGIMMFGYVVRDEIIGFLSIKQVDHDSLKINDIIVLPEYQRHGYGQELLDFAKQKAAEFGLSKITLGMIDDNVRLKNWYSSNGFKPTGTRKFEKAPFTVGYMECMIT